MKITRQKLRQLIKESFKEKWEQRLSQEPEAWSNYLRGFRDMINDKEWEAAAFGMLDYPEIAYQISIRYNYPDAFSQPRGRLELFFDFIVMHPEYEDLDNAIYESRTDGSKEQREHQIKRDITQLLNPYRGQIDDLKLGLDLLIDLYPFKFGVNISTKDLNILQQIETDAKSQGIETMAINKIAESRYEKSRRL